MHFLPIVMSCWYTLLETKLLLDFRAEKKKGDGKYPKLHSSSVLTTSISKWGKIVWTEAGIWIQKVNSWSGTWLPGKETQVRGRGREEIETKRWLFHPLRRACCSKEPWVCTNIISTQSPGSRQNIGQKDVIPSKWILKVFQTWPSVHAAFDLDEDNQAQRRSNPQPWKLVVKHFVIHNL